MKRIIYILIACFLFVQTAYSQKYNARPSWGTYYNGYGIQPGYRYNYRNGWNSLEFPGGRFSYRDGYVPPRRYYNYNPWLNTYSSTINQFAYPGMGW